MFGTFLIHVLDDVANPEVQVAEALHIGKQRDGVVVDVEGHVFDMLVVVLVERGQHYHAVLAFGVEGIAVLVHHVAVGHVFRQVVPLRRRRVGDHGCEVGKEDVAAANLVEHLGVDVALAGAVARVLVDNQLDAVGLKGGFRLPQRSVDDRAGIFPVVLPREEQSILRHISLNFAPVSSSNCHSPEVLSFGLCFAYATPMVRGGHTDFTDFTDIALRAFCSGLVRQAHHESSLARGRVRDYFIPSGLLLMMIVHVTKCSLYEYRVYGVASNHPNKCMVVGIVAEHMELVNIGQRYGYRLLGL